MVRAWYMNEVTTGDQREPHMLDPPKFVELKDLEKLGLLYYQIFSDDYTKCEELNKLRKDRHYTFEDEITCSREKLANYEETLKMFFKEHIHSDEEIRLITDGSGYFDVRDYDDKWIRIEVEKGDLLIIPAGIYHRFTLDEKVGVLAENYIEARRYFSGVPVWTPFYRPAEDHESRKNYLQTHSKS